jgi:hypothetical protein
MNVIRISKATRVLCLKYWITLFIECKKTKERETCGDSI